MCMFQQVMRNKPLTAIRKGFKSVDINRNGLPEGPFQCTVYAVGKWQHTKLKGHDAQANPGFNIFTKLKDAENYTGYINIPVTAKNIVSTTDKGSEIPGFCAMDMFISRNDWVKALAAYDKTEVGKWYSSTPLLPKFLAYEKRQKAARKSAKTRSKSKSKK